MSKYYLGAMTGTSLDAIDLALCKFDSYSDGYTFELVQYLEIDFPPKLKVKILEIINSDINIKQVSQLNFAISHFYAESINSFIQHFNISNKDIIAVGIHGQTVWHEPSPSYYGEFLISSTMQLGNISAISQLIGIRTIGDFRSADIALGGMGAPLVPIFDFYMLKGNINKIALNIGGISNITYLPANCKISDVIAFDTGPGNVWIDMSMKHFFNANYDGNGQTAAKGKVDNSMLEYLMNNFYFIKNKPPKSTGRELFSQENFNLLLSRFYDIYKYNFVATLTEFTAQSIAFNINLYTKNAMELIISGGGAKNSFLLERISLLLGNCRVITSNEIGINSDAKEAVCFAFLAYLFDNNIDGNIPSVTGATRSTILGISSK